MKEKRAITPYMFSADMGVNAFLSINKIRKRLRKVNPEYKFKTRYQRRIKRDKWHSRRARLWCKNGCRGEFK